MIGWNEYVQIPDWGIRDLRAKVDTGAKSSALHVEGIRELPRNRVRFEVVLHRRKRDRRVPVETRIVRRSRVRSSTGEYSTRVFVEADVVLGPITRRIELSLVDRQKMIHRMLLGRTALEDDFLVDVAHRCLLTRKRRRKKKAKRRKKPRERRPR